MAHPAAPQDVVALAEERAAARVARDFETADRLKTRIEAAGWKVVDFGAGFDLEPARPADVIEDGQTLYGAVESVPSRLDEPATTQATVVLVADDGPAAERSLEAIARTIPTGTQVVVVTGPVTALDGPEREIVGTAVPFSAGDALQAALRRATGEVVVVLEPGHVPTSDVVLPLVEALRDPQVAIAAAAGLHSRDLHRYEPAAPGEVTTVAAGCYAFRRAEAIAKGPIDGRLMLPGSVAAWLGLLLRDAGPDSPPRQAVVLQLPLGAPELELPSGTDDARLARRDGYRLADRFRHRGWLTGDEPPEGRVVGDGADDSDRHDDSHESDHAGHP